MWSAGLFLLTYLFIFSCPDVEESYMLVCRWQHEPPGSEHTHSYIFIQLRALFLTSSPNSTTVFMNRDSTSAPALSLTCSSVPLLPSFSSRLVQLHFLSFRHFSSLSFHVQKHSSTTRLFEPVSVPAVYPHLSKFRLPPGIWLIANISNSLTLAHTLCTVHSHAFQNEAAATHVPIRIRDGWV